jgi:hypothetical protein
MGKWLTQDFQGGTFEPIQLRQMSSLPGLGIGLFDSVPFAAFEIPVLIEELGLPDRPNPADRADPFPAGVETNRSASMKSRLAGLRHAGELYRNKEVNTGIDKKEPAFP